MPYKEKKSIDKVYFSIGEVADIFGVKPSMIRYYDNELNLPKLQRTCANKRKFTKQDIINFYSVWYLTQIRDWHLKPLSRFKNNHLKELTLTQLYLLEGSTWIPAVFSPDEVFPKITTTLPEHSYAQITMLAPEPPSPIPPSSGMDYPIRFWSRIENCEIVAGTSHKAFTFWRPSVPRAPLAHECFFQKEQFRRLRQFSIRLHNSQLT